MSLKGIIELMNVTLNEITGLAYKYNYNSFCSNNISNSSNIISNSNNTTTTTTTFGSKNNSLWEVKCCDINSCNSRLIDIQIYQTNIKS